MFHKLLDEGQAGDNIGALLRGVQRNEIERGQVLAKPGSVTCHKKFTAQVYVLTKDEGGRHTPFFNNYRPQFYFRTTDVTEMCIRDRKENVIIGKLIPAGTGMKSYRSVKLDTDMNMDDEILLSDDFDDDLVLDDFSDDMNEESDVQAQEMVSAAEIDE